ncbi:hypothetical protein ACPOL_2710 [Acidisarcina polymorpha]|uniref:Uncharacterized protein n=1 Tax=Acidisarcina polymorpha TaxID=2211140 RepID=A0A2Z5FYN6_9BACT|nr:hypothetical protein ACPOL_2710 [Acidisarcina polymorpha]
MDAPNGPRPRLKKGDPVIVQGYPYSPNWIAHFTPKHPC